MKHQISLLFLLVAFAFAVPTFAQTDATTDKQQAVKELVALVNVGNKAEDLVRVMTNQFERMYVESVKSTLDQRADLSAAEKSEIETAILKNFSASIKRSQDKFLQKLNYNAMITEIAESIFDKNYTLEEIRDLLTFYKTPTGQKALNLMVPIASESVKLVTERILPKLPEIIREIEEETRKEIIENINAHKPKPKSKATE